jgi:hypothetical protein
MPRSELVSIPVFLRKRPNPTLEELKTEAIAELERRGFEVRGKTPTQIRKLLRPRSKKPNPKQTGSGWRTDRLGD